MRSSGTLYFLLGAYFLLHVLIRLAMPASLELDEGQQLFFSQSLSLGYDSQPPFYNWLQYGAVQIFGTSVAALTILKNLLLFLSYMFLGMTANLLLRDKGLAAIATLGLVTITQVSFEAQRDLTHTVAVLFSAGLFIYAFVKTLKQASAWRYALTGLAVGFGVLSKYNFVLLPEFSRPPVRLAAHVVDRHCCGRRCPARLVVLSSHRHRHRPHAGQIDWR